MYANQLETYKSVQKTTMSDREIEASVLTKAAMKLKACQDRWDAADRAETLDEALRFNQLMWSIFQVELARPENPLPKQIKENILSLSAFIDKRIFDVMAYPAPEKLDIIININMNLSAGLRGTPAAP